MKNYFKYIAVLALGVVSCEPELENPVDGGEIYSNGTADFSNYVALGNSLTAGYADGALYLSGQQNSYPNILAEKFAVVQPTQGFTQPLVNDNAGGLLLGGNKIADTRFVLSVGANGPVPKRYRGAAPTTEVSNKLTGPFNNMGVPGAKVYHLGFQGYGSVAAVSTGLANPYFARFSSADNATVLGDALAQDPTFFTLWIGNNDVLGYASSGGVGEYQLNNTNPATYGPNDITDPNLFAFSYGQIVEALAQKADGVLLNIPDVTSSPYFTTVPNNALALDAATAGQLTAYFQAVAGVMTQVLMQQNVPAEQAQAIASQYAIKFNEGPNRFLIDVEKTQTNPLGFRQMTAEEMILLTVDQAALASGYGSVKFSQEVGEVIAVLQSGGSLTQEQVQILFGAVDGLDDKDALDTEELGYIQDATTRFNAAIKLYSEQFGLGFVDAQALQNQLNAQGIAFDGGVVTSDFVTGGAFSLDGIHLTPRGYAVIANAIIEETNATYGSNVPKANVGAYGTVTLSQDVQ
ncbi:G-D-S-L family lipolytic protein [Christiangramia aquimixticola]|uniref:G-D-S-L family lipolytic protein n=1 Tax=Christiangramia aquimixticola TaxID=1697558 RepID=UPI003AA874DA